MSSTDVHRRLEVFDETECRRLLAIAVIGRLGYTEGALPSIQPVHFTVFDGQVIIPTRVGSKVAAASRGAVVAFEVDEYDAALRTGWNVTVIGPSRVISDPDGVHALDELGAQAWAPPDAACYVAVQIAIVRGRRVIAASAVAEGTEAVLAAVPCGGAK
ncbi:pyridoxamine 5'-phosphate oxidase family protein [Blastococcus atacamensis]|uniref:pyridoxamine 5'-phosphate oxidase family protein n=1 Tax=Blastococcus atacamensis TaxID=2070508 RepID=UPI000CECB94F|nr:pyridoxamine 5'-phosphate oxidase family protein [Blastococcus atacamensis]